MKPVAVELRHRAGADENIEVRFARFQASLKNVGSPWGWNSDLTMDLPDIGDGLEVQIDLSEALESVSKGYAAFVFRGESYIRDDSEFDDRLVLNFEVEGQSYQELVHFAFPRYVESFAAYRGTIIMDQGLALDDWDKVVELCQEGEGDIDGRDGVFRINAVNFFDEELCRRAFNMAPHQIVSKLKGCVDYISLVGSGLFLVVTTELLNRRQLELLDETVRKHL